MDTKHRALYSSLFSTLAKTHSTTPRSIPRWIMHLRSLLTTFMFDIESLRGFRTGRTAGCAHGHPVECGELFEMPAGIVGEVLRRVRELEKEVGKDEVEVEGKGYSVLCMEMEMLLGWFREAQKMLSFVTYERDQYKALGKRIERFLAPFEEEEELQSAEWWFETKSAAKSIAAATTSTNTHAHRFNRTASQLPFEVLAHILTFIPDGELRQTSCAVSLVNKTWSYAGRSTLYTHVSLSSGITAYRFFLGFALNTEYATQRPNHWMRWHIRHLETPHEFLPFIVDHILPSLRSLTLHGVCKVTDLTPLFHTTPPQVSNLRQLRIKGCTTTRAVISAYELLHNHRNAFNYEPTYPRQQAQRFFSSLSAVHFDTCFADTLNAASILSDCGMTREIQSITIPAVSIFESAESRLAGIHNFFSHQKPNLRAVDLSAFGCIDDKTLDAMSENCPNLHALCLPLNPSPTTTDHHHHHPHHPHQHQHQRAPHLSDTALTSFFTLHGPTLTYLRTSHLTPHLASLLTEHCTSLRYLIINPAPTTSTTSTTSTSSSPHTSPHHRDDDSSTSNIHAHANVAERDGTTTCFEAFLKTRGSSLKGVLVVNGDEQDARCEESVRRGVFER